MARILVLTVILALGASSVQAQDKGQVGVLVKAQLIPQAGLIWHPSSRLSFRLAAYAEGNSVEVIDFDDAVRVSTAILLRFPVDETLSSYVGADFTVSTFEEENYMGPLFGAHYQAHPRLGIFGEFGFSVDIEGEIDIISMFNTGAGVVLYLNR